MWAYRLQQPKVVERIVLPEGRAPLARGDVRVRLTAAGLCGSDMPRFLGTHGPGVDGTYGLAPVHEVVGEVVEATTAQFASGQRVVGALGRDGGLAEYVVADGSRLVAVPEELNDVEAVSVQSLATILRAASKLPEPVGKRAVVLGAGPIGLAFCHVLKHYGTAQVTAIDPVDRTGTAEAFGADRFFHMTSAEWLKTLKVADRPDIVIEAVGHQQATLRDAILGVADHGFVFGFGEPDDVNYEVPYEELYLRDATLASGRTTTEWPQVLSAAGDYLLRYRGDFGAYISHVIDAKEAQRAYSLYAQPQVGRLKVVMVP